GAELATAAAPAPGWAVTTAGRLECGMRPAAMMSHHHRADAVHEQRTANHADCGCSGRAEKRAAGRRLWHRLSHGLSHGLPHGLLHGLRLAPIAGRSAHRSTRGLAALSHRRDCACAFSKSALAHAFEEAALPRRLAAAAELCFELADAGLGALERLVLDQGGLHQRIGRIGGLAEAVLNQAFGLSIAG